MHTTTVFRLALSCLAFALFATAKGHGSFEKHRPKPSPNDSHPDSHPNTELPAGAVIKPFVNEADVRTWFDTYAALPKIQVSVLTYNDWNDSNLANFPYFCVSALKADAVKAAKNLSDFPFLLAGIGQLSTWFEDDHVVIVVCQTFAIPKRTGNATAVETKAITPYSSRVDLAVKRLNAEGHKITLAATGTSVEDALKNAAKNNVKLGNGVPVYPLDPVSSKDAKPGVGKGDKDGGEKGDGGGAKKGSGGDKKTNSDDKWSDGDKGKKGKAFHKDEKTSKQP